MSGLMIWSSMVGPLELSGDQIIGPRGCSHGLHGAHGDRVRIVAWCSDRAITIFESYTPDPLCQAVEQAWKAGIVVVVAAGNYGRDNSNNNYGPSEITLTALQRPIGPPRGGLVTSGIWPAAVPPANIRAKSETLA